MDKIIWQRSFGKMNRSNPQAPPLSDRTAFPIASVTKVLTVRKMNLIFYVALGKRVKYKQHFNEVDFDIRIN